MELNRYANEPAGAGHGIAVNLPSGFDPLAAHEWTIRWSLAEIGYYVDGALLYTATTYVPQGPMHVEIEAWSPDTAWLAAYSPSILPVSSSAQNKTFTALVMFVTVTSAQLFGSGTLSTAGAMPHFTSGAGWQTSFVLMNVGSAAAHAHLNFYDDNGAALPLPLCFPQQSSGATQTAAQFDQSIAPGAAVVVTACGAVTAPATSACAQFQTDGAVTGFARFDWSIAGGLQEAVVPMEWRSPSAFVISYDQTGGFATGLAGQTRPARAAA